MKRVVLLVVQHDAAVTGYCLVDDDAHHLLACERVLEHLFTEDAGELHPVH